MNNFTKTSLSAFGVAIALMTGIAPETSPANHSPLYAVDEAVLPLGMRVLANLAADYLFGK